MGLRSFPYGGRAGRLPGSRELVVAPYIVVYRVKNELIEISRIYHSAQDWP
jgi:toxin ParE1/3/4